MDNIVFSTMIGLVAAFITAVLGFTKLINDKEGKTSDFRQEWTVSIRQILSELVSNFRYLVDLYEKSDAAAAVCESLANEMAETGIEISTPIYEVTKEGLLFNKGKLEKASQEITQTWKDIHKNISLAQMHFEHNDCEFNLIESKINSVMTILKKLIAESDLKLPKDVIENNLRIAKSEIETYCIEITFTSRLILKNEWERIKKGEHVYQKTKRFFKNSSLIVSAMIATLFIAIFIAKYSNHLADQKIKNYSESNKSGHISATEKGSQKCYSEVGSTQSYDCSSHSSTQSLNVDKEEITSP